jgi:hypothetical protein
MHRPVHAFDLHLSEIGNLEVPLYLRRGMRREVDLARFGDLFHAGREADGVSLRSVVHAQVIADLADDHLTGVEAQACREVEAAAQAQLVGIAA